MFILNSEQLGTLIITLMVLVVVLALCVAHNDLKGDTDE